MKYQEQLQPLQDQLLKIREENAYEIQQVRSVLTETQRDLYTKTNQVQLLEVDFQFKLMLFKNFSYEFQFISRTV